MRFISFSVLLLLAVPECAQKRAQERVLDCTEGKKTCEVHNVSLSEGIVRIYYGLPVRPSAEEQDAADSKFPNASLKYLGGCVVEKTKWAKVSYCPECREAEKAWRASHVAGSAGGAGEAFDLWFFWPALIGGVAAALVAVIGAMRALPWASIASLVMVGIVGAIVVLAAANHAPSTGPDEQGNEMMRSLIWSWTIAACISATAAIALAPRKLASRRKVSDSCA